MVQIFIGSLPKTLISENVTLCRDKQILPWPRPEFHFKSVLAMQVHSTFPNEIVSLLVSGAFRPFENVLHSQRLLRGEMADAVVDM